MLRMRVKESDRQGLQFGKKIKCCNSRADTSTHLLMILLAVAVIWSLFFLSSASRDAKLEVSPGSFITWRLLLKKLWGAWVVAKDNSEEMK